MNDDGDDDGGDGARKEGLGIPWNSIGATTSTFIMGSKITGLAARYASRNAPIAVSLNASSEESTAWYAPSSKRKRHPVTGFPDSAPFSNASRKPWRMNGEKKGREKKEKDIT